MIYKTGELPKLLSYGSIIRRKSNKNRLYVVDAPGRDKRFIRYICDRHYVVVGIKDFRKCIDMHKNNVITRQQNKKR